MMRMVVVVTFVGTPLFGMPLMYVVVIVCGRIPLFIGALLVGRGFVMLCMRIRVVGGFFRHDLFIFTLSSEDREGRNNQQGLNRDGRGEKQP